MAEPMLIQLTNELPQAQWGEHNTLSFDAGQATIHLSGDDYEDLRRIQRAARQLDGMGVKNARLHNAWTLEQQWSFAQGYYNAKQNSQITWAEGDTQELNARYKAMAWCREMTNLPPQDIYPETLANRAAQFIEELAGDAVSFKIIKGIDLLEQGWIGIHAVGRASEKAPVMLQLDYNPSGDENAPVDAVLVGKGITFDSGGYSIKPSEGMLTMKCDMGGAATVTAGLALAIERGMKKRVQLILCCAENLINGQAYKLGDILTYKNGTTVEVVNTDAEGRLVLADGLLAAGETGAPLIIDAATLTGAAMMAVGGEYNALFGLDRELQQRVMGYAEQENEAVWPLPLMPWHKDNCPSAYADTANSRPQKGGGMGGASNAAGFLSRFVPENGKGWVHLDLAGAFHNTGNAFWATGATGMGIRTIAKTLMAE